ncbi:MAG: hypothetical protein ABSG25_10420 [Bryobacteraceae bacterium]
MNCSIPPIAQVQTIMRAGAQFETIRRWVRGEEVEGIAISREYTNIRA